MTEAKDIRTAWEKQPDTFPDFLSENSDIFPKIKVSQKKENEALVQEFSQRIQKKLRQKPKEKERQSAWEQELEQDFMTFLEREKILNLSAWMSPELLNSFKQETKHFVDRVRAFDETLTPAQIWQTLRNYFIYAMVVDMQGEKQNAGNPILAYSLLYPYTDNYIDDDQISKSDKKRYNQMIALKLQGESAVPHNSLEEKTCCLLDMILEAYEGAEQKKIAETLLRLLEAQNNSIGQQQKDVTEEQILEISIHKGSTSVLADYLFATTNWTGYEESFYLKFGFLLQLVDDLQDIEEDRKSGSHTLMTETERQQKLEQCTNRLLWFTWNVIREFEPVNPELKGFVLKYCVEISLLTAAMNQQFFSKKYLKALEPYLPFSVDFLKKMKKQQGKLASAYQTGSINSEGVTI
ncbi:MAG: class 1 isoprenoid biosynthesis enzyme [Lachnospiraceae bacterium]|nr:class 1 isoprenoid biosynthesis enzyme [Lachnospiraceae bacterium]